MGRLGGLLGGTEGLGCAVDDDIGGRALGVIFALVLGLVGITEGGAAAALDFEAGNLAPPRSWKGGSPCRTSFG